MIGTNDLRIRTWSNFLPRHLVNLEIRSKRMQLGRVLTIRATAGAKLNSQPIPPGASISVEISPYPLFGHQVSSWIAGYLWADLVGVSFRGGVIPADSRGLLNTKSHEVAAAGDERTIRAVPVEDELDPRSLPALRGQIVRRSRRRRTQFRLCRDPQWWDQTPAAPVIRQALQSGYLGQELQDLEHGDRYIALHVRRGSDIDQETTGGQGIVRWLEQDYYLQIVRRLRATPKLESLPIWIVSVCELDGFSELLAMPNVHVRYNGDRDRDLVFLAGATVLITSPSSFSFTAALASKGVAIVRHPWWHNVPDSGRWVRATHEGIVHPSALRRAVDETH